ncbi:hypothetical protein PIB30_009677 [Stylosanthes scabra]|uniref:Oxidoreductase FAD/NAD(P)-binding domain-containing protein n=1 Tax=Stylosanthes scabra TaxID=79078 RepID=A0ABU6U405_9FABA|nr:hypothetical protein [Stylosanthes scabra]
MTSPSSSVHLIYTNVTYEDILLKDELDGLVANHPDQFKVYYVLNQREARVFGCNLVGTVYCTITSMAKSSFI